MTKIEYFQYLLTQNRPKFPSIVPVQSQTSPNRKILISLAELADPSTSENLIFSRLEIRFDDKPSIIDESILMNNIKDFPIDIYESRSNEEGTWSKELFPLLLLQKFNLLLRRYLLFVLFAVLFDLFGYLAAHLLKFYCDFCPFLFY
jgi:hypothetical protein